MPPVPPPDRFVNSTTSEPCCPPRGKRGATGSTGASGATGTTGVTGASASTFFAKFSGFVGPGAGATQYLADAGADNTASLNPVRYPLPACTATGYRFEVTIPVDATCTLNFIKNSTTVIASRALTGADSGLVVGSFTESFAADDTFEVKITDASGLLDTLRFAGTVSFTAP